MAPPLSRSSGTASWGTHAVFMLSGSLACLVWSWAAGKDLNWDQINYHFYSAYHYLDDRLEQDFMGASIQGYLNPLGYVPFYLMVRANWPSLLIGSVLAFVHSACLWLVYGISRELIPPETRSRTAMIAASVALAFLAPIYLIEVGSTFIDVTTTIPVLAGILLLLICDRSRRQGLLVLLAGALMGAASGLKPTNAVFAVAAAAFILFATRPLTVKVRDLGFYGAGGFAGVLVVDGAWAYQLFKTFGNPLFPMFNARFQSPDLPAFDLTHYRFLPETLGDYLLFPFRVADLRDYVYTETMSPDVRFLALLALIAALGTALLVRGRKPVDASADSAGASMGRGTYSAALAFALTSYVLWLASSANGRYAIPLELFIGPMIVATAVALSRSGRILAYLTGTVLLVQATVVYVSADHRWQPADWTATWYEVNVPTLLEQRSFLYLSLDQQTAAFLAPFLHSGSSFVNLVGQTSLAPDRPGGQRLRLLLDRHRPNIRTLILLRTRTEAGEPHPRMFAIQDTLLERVGLRTDPRDCVSIEVHGLLGYGTAFGNASTHSEMQYSSDRRFLTCGTMPVARTSALLQLDERRARVDRAFDMLEALCPRQFSPPRPYTDHVDTAFSRSYVNTDAKLREFNGVIKYSGWRSDDAIVLGRLEDILDGSVVPNCRSISRPPPRTEN